MESVDKDIQFLLENSKSPLSEGFQRYRLEQQWSRVVGKQIGEWTRPVDCKKGFLIIAVKNASLLTELQFFRQEIIDKVNVYVGSRWVKKIHFTTE